MSYTWNPWHGCRKLSAGCLNCYVYRMDGKYEKNASEIRLNASFDMPVRRRRSGEYLLAPGSYVYTCFTSDFLLEEADIWRPRAYAMIRERADCEFLFVTKRIDRLGFSLPTDWGEGYENLHVCCTVENEDRAAYRLPIFLAAPIRHKSIICEPLLGHIDLSAYLGPTIEEVVAGGESGENARPCDCEWVYALRAQCIAARVPFHFAQTGARFIKNGRLYNVPRKYQHSQARLSGLDYYTPPL